MTNTNNYRPMISASREELDITLNVVPILQNLPDDIEGYLYLASSVGSVNSNGLPFPQYNEDGSPNQEYGSPIMNGDGMVFQLCFDAQKNVTLKTRLLKTPCYYADEATAPKGALGQDSTYHKYAFRNTGIARISLHLGARNELNTAFTPFQWKNDTYPRITATYDIGRPFEIDPQTLALVTPVGKNKEWTPSTPAFIRLPFPLIQTTAHPVFDPLTHEFFTVNYTKSLHTMFSSMELLEGLIADEDALEKKLEGIAQSYEQHQQKDKALKEVHHFFNNPFLSWIESKIEGFFETKDELFLMRWTGEPNQPLDKWQLIDPDGNNIAIKQCMHQIALSKDYLILSDTSFKFTIDMLINNPFPHNHLIDRFIREITSEPMEAFLSVYLVKRSDLDSSKSTITATPLKTPIPLEAIHFSANYENPNNEITLYMAHNAAACLAEWLRPYDTLAANGRARKLDDTLLGMFAVGGMDIGRIGKFVIDVNNASIIEEKSTTIHETGNLDNINQIGAHTWEIGLYTFRDIVAPDVVVPEIKNLFYTCYGLDPRILTHFIHQLYKDYPNRIIPVDELEKYTSVGLPSVLLRVDAAQMQIADFYQVPFDFNFRSVQFIPRKTPNPALDPSLDGYIFCAMVNVIEGTEPSSYVCEFWVFDAANLAQGPLCKLTNDALDFTFPLHSAWLKTAQKNAEQTYKVDIKEDYNDLIDSFLFPKKRKNMQYLFDNFVYPHFQ